LAFGRGYFVKISAPYHVFSRIIGNLASTTFELQEI